MNSKAFKLIHLLNHQIDKYSCVLILLLLISALLRIYNFPYRYGLGEETVRDAAIGIEAARQLQLPLTGSFSSLGPFTFGPWYAYQLAFAYLIFPNNYSPWVYLTLLSIFYVFVMYKIGEILNGKVFGLILAALVTFSPAQVISATHLTSHNNTNIFAALTFFIFLKILKNDISYWWGFTLGIIIGIGMNLHYQMSGLLTFPLLLLFFKRKRYLYFISCLCGVIVTFIPLLIFELNNHWFNVRNMIHYFLYDRYKIYIPNRWLFYLRDFWPAFWADALGIPKVLAILIISIFSIISFLKIKTKKLSPAFIALLVVFIVNFIMLRYYWGHRFFGYLNFLRPFVFIFTGYVFFTIYQFTKGNILAVLGLLVLTLLGISRTIDQTTRDPFTLKIYDFVSSLEKSYPNRSFSIFGCTKKYVGGYDALSFSYVFILDLKNKLSKDGMKMAVESPYCKFPKNKHITRLSKQQLIDATALSEKELYESGWRRVSFTSIYDASARWWFKEQP